MLNFKNRHFLHEDDREFQCCLLKLIGSIMSPLYMGKQEQDICLQLIFSLFPKNCCTFHATHRTGILNRWCSLPLRPQPFFTSSMATSACHNATEELCRRELFQNLAGRCCAFPALCGENPFHLISMPILNTLKSFTFMTCYFSASFRAYR